MSNSGSSAGYSSPTNSDSSSSSRSSSASPRSPEASYSQSRSHSISGDVGLPGSEAAMAELLSAIDEGSLNPNQARSLKEKGANLKQGLAYALTAGSIEGVLALAHGSGARLDNSTAKVKEVHSLATLGDWPMVAYHLAIAASKDNLEQLLMTPDGEAQRRLRELAGQVQVQLPRDVRATFARTGTIPHILLIESKRWLLPRPSKDQSYVAVDGSRLEDGWYSVVQYPLADDLKEALLRCKYWDNFKRPKAAELLHSSGETIFCKAAKASQWPLVTWLLEQSADPLKRLEELNSEFLNLWSSTCIRTAFLHKKEDVGELSACLDNDGVLSKPWRVGALEVPVGAQIMWPALATLRDALSKGPLAIKFLDKINSAKVTFRIPQTEEAIEAWRKDLYSLGESSLGLPLLHRAAMANNTPLMEKVVEALADLDQPDIEGRTALAAAAAAAGNFEGLDLLLREGCRTDGVGGAAASSALKKKMRSGTLTPEEVERVTDFLQRIYERRERPPTSDLREYFLRWVKGEVMHGLEPRGFQLVEGELRSRTTPVRVTTKPLLLSTTNSSHLEVRFLDLDAATSSSVASVGLVDLARKVVLPENLLLKRGSATLVAPVVLPFASLGAVGPDGNQGIKSAGEGRMAGFLPALAKLAPPGGLRIKSITACCRESVGRVDISIDGVRVGETADPLPGSSIANELELLVPPRQMQVAASLCGRKLMEESIEGGPDAEWCVEVSISIFVYKQLIDEDTNLEFVFVCGHRRDVPEDATPFLGIVKWDEGTMKIDKTFEPVVLGKVDCLSRLQSMRLEPQLTPGRSFEAVEWEDTSTPEMKACQFQRCLVNPVRVGKIFQM